MSVYEDIDNAIPLVSNELSSQANSSGDSDSPVANQIIEGTALADVLTGGLGNDGITGFAGNDSIDGGLGEDSASYSGNQQSYTLTLNGDAIVLADRRSDGDGTDTLANIEFLNFDTEIPAFNENSVDLRVFGGHQGIEAGDLESIIELYIAYFNRAPDAVGLGFWATGFNKGLALDQIASQFMQQDETRAKFLENTTDEEFVGSVYLNVLGRASDDTGLAFWVEHLESGALSREAFILEFLQGARSELKTELGQEFVDQQLADRAYLDTQVDIGAYFAVHKGMSNIENASTVMALFDGTKGSVDAAIIAADALYQDALDPVDGEFLMQVVGVLDDPFS